jgi:hypothetical protein
MSEPWPQDESDDEGAPTPADEPVRQSDVAVPELDDDWDD